MVEEIGWEDPVANAAVAMARIEEVVFSGEGACRVNQVLPPFLRSNYLNPSGIAFEYQ